MVKVVKRPGFINRNFYLPATILGLLLTCKHFFINLITGKKRVTISYPEQKRQIAKRWRGRHRLTRDENGFIKCVACYMCETICPARCIHIEAAESINDKSIEKYPRIFDIDELRCVFCGLCVEACPEDAIRMDTDIIGMSHNSRQQFDYTRDLLLDEYKQTKHTKYSTVPLPGSMQEALPNSTANIPK